jgi:hypothetical protein
MSPTTTVGMARSVSESNLRGLRRGNSKKPKINPKGKPINKLKTIDRVELLIVIIMAEMVSGSRRKSRKNASFKPSKIKSKPFSLFTFNLKNDRIAQNMLKSHIKSIKRIILCFQ